MSEAGIPDITGEFNKEFAKALVKVQELKKYFPLLISNCADPEKRLMFQGLIDSVNEQQAEVERVLPTMVSETEARIRSDMKEIQALKAEGEALQERILELKQQAEDACRELEAKHAERASQPAEPTATDLAHEYLKGLNGAAAAVNLPLNEGKILVEHLLGLGVKPEAPKPPTPKPKRLGNIWENWEPHSTESSPDTDSP